MQKALALQAEARKKIAQSEALLAQYGLADVAPSRRQRRRRQGGSNRGVRAMSAYQSNAGFDRSQLHHINKDSRESAPSPMLPHGGHAQNEGTPTTSAVHAFGNEHSGASLNAKAQPWGDATASRSWSGRSAWPRIYRNEDNQAAAKIIEV